MAKSLVLALTVCFMIATVNCSLINVLKRQIMFGGTIGQITRTNNYSIPYQPLPPPQHGINFDSTTNINFNSPISQNEPQNLPSFNNNGNLKSYFFFHINYSILQDQLDKTQYHPLLIQETITYFYLEKRAWIVTKMDYVAIIMFNN